MKDTAEKTSDPSRKLADAVRDVKNAFADRDDANWRKHTLAHVSENGKVTLDYRPVHTEPLLSEADGGISRAKIAPKARVY